MCLFTLKLQKTKVARKKGHSEDVSARTLPKLLISRMEELITAAECDLTWKRVAVAT